MFAVLEAEKEADQRSRGGDSHGARGPQNQCFIHACQSVGVHSLKSERPGPFWALKDGISMLRPHGHHIKPASFEDLRGGGSFIMHTYKFSPEGHFQGVLISGCNAVVLDGPDAHVDELCTV